jgi:parvulin-like peptidyl-prolyl isomerase
MGVRWCRRALAIVVVAALSACAGGSASSSSDATAQPVAKVGSTVITQTQFQIRLQSTLTSIAQGGGSTSDPTMVTSVRASVLRSLILDTVIAQEAQRLGLAATDAQVQAQVNSDAQSVGGMSNLETQLSEAGGSIAQLQDEIRSQLNEQRLEDYFAQQRAAQVEQQLAEGTPFATVAQQVSDDENSASKGGDLGALTAAALSQDDATFAAAVKTLAVGTYTTKPVHDQGGYDIIMVYAKTPTTWSVRHILVAAPTPYTVTSRPTWFTEALFSTVQQLCEQNQIQVYISNAGSNPCSTSTPSPSASSQKASAAPTPIP